MDNAGLPQVKTCSKCSITKTIDDFGTSRTSSGKPLKRAQCRECYNAGRRAHYSIEEVHAEKTKKRREYQSRPSVVENRRISRSTPEAKEKSRIAAQKYRSKPEAKIKIRSQRDIHIAQPHIKARMVFLAAKARAEKKDLEFNLTEEWVQSRINIGTCEMTGIPFDFSRPKTNWQKNPFTPSVDRICSDGGYTQDNCRLVLTAVNIALGQWGDEVFSRISHAFVAQRQINQSQSI